MHMRKLTLFSIVIFVAFSCNRKTINLDNQTNEILQLLVNRFQLNENINTILPLPWTPTDKDTFVIDGETIIGQDINKRIEEHNLRINNSNTKIIIAVVDSTDKIDWNDVLERFENNEIVYNIIQQNSTAKESREIEINNININPDYEIIKLSLLKEKYEKNNKIKIPERKFGALIGYSDIYFNKEHNYGLLYFMYSPLLFEGGEGYYVLIEKKNNKWKIKELKLDWVV